MSIQMHLLRSSRKFILKRAYISSLLNSVINLLRGKCLWADLAEKKQVRSTYNRVDHLQWKSRPQSPLTFPNWILIINLVYNKKPGADQTPLSLHVSTNRFLRVVRHIALHFSVSYSCETLLFIFLNNGSLNEVRFQNYFSSFTNPTLSLENNGLLSSPSRRSLKCVAQK